MIIPIIHTAADMMSLKSSIPRDEKDEVFALAHWKKVFKYFRHRPRSLLRGLKVYQDGLPDTSEDNLNKILAIAQTKNYDVLRWLRSKGAVIMGTESTHLLLEEYQLLAAMYNPPDEESWAQATLERLSRRVQLLTERDSYIAKGIDSTLMPGEVGLLFIGLGHNIKPLLMDKMRLKEPRMFSSGRLSAEWGRELACQSV